ncbi:MAG: 1-acyl-sn-glycerol-3-phosphate acyltransferase [Phaeodactylibacter sp.]|uniref:1-acyl-sn-glycerol-3-phosphate acyltransferase n=1 Tax=Phaeodactylibacter sp. TaxID=1940289 RepID=UPI0032EAC6CA
MNPILYFIYQFLKLVTKISFRVYYPNATRLNLDRLRYRGGSILVSNHPNTLLDPLNAACRVPKVVHFLANASLFQTPFTHWFFNTFYCIPVERPQDTKGKPINNANAFRKSQQFIRNGGCLYIAPEGGSDMERRVRPFKTGTARILLGAAAQQNFETDLQILPVGLTYDHANRFRSRMTVNAAPPILARDYADLYQKDIINAARQLTQDLEQAIRDHTIDTKDKTEDTLVLRAEALLRNSFPVSGAAHFKRTKDWIAEWRKQVEEAAETCEAYLQQQEQYWSKLESAQTTDRAVAAPHTAAFWIPLILGAPFALYGWLNNLLPGYLPKIASEKLDLYVGYTATVQILCGLLTFPVFYTLQSLAVGTWLGPGAGWLYLLSLPLSGWLYLKWKPLAQRGRHRQRAKRIRDWAGLQEERSQLLKATLHYLNP